MHKHYSIVKEKIYWRIVQHICGTTLHVDKQLMESLGYFGARDQYSYKTIAKVYAHRYAVACARMGMSSSEIYVVSGTLEQERV